MPSRRTFLTSAALAAAGAAAAPVVAQTRQAGGNGSSAPLPKNPEGGRYRPPHKFGVGGVQAGNAFFKDSPL